jgi:small conductance mechanosensitive channel
MELQQWQETLIDFGIRYGFQIFGALVILTAGILVAWWLGKVASGWMSKHRFEPPVRILITRVIRLLIVVCTMVIALDKFGVEIAPLIAGLGVAGLGVGLALQGVLSNVVAGLTIIFTKPFRVGEYIEIADVAGEVTHIELFCTTLVHPDLSRVVIPNRKIVGEILHNHGHRRQLDLDVAVAYDSDLPRVLATVRELLQANPRVLKEPTPLIGIEQLGDSGIHVTVRPWVAVPDYVEAQLELYQGLVERFRGASITIPFPQREVRMLGAAPPARSA